MVYAILLIIIVVCLGVIFYLASGKFNKLRLIAVETIPAEKQSEVKERLLESRLQKRLLKAGWRALTRLINIFKSVGRLAQRVIVIIKAQKRSGRSTREILPKRELKAKSAVVGKYEEAEILMKKRQYDEAEAKYIEILKEEPKNIDVYMALGEIYTLRKEWPTAEETYRHVMRIDPQFLPAEKELATLLKMMKKWEELKQLGEYIIKNGNEEAWVYVDLGLGYRKTGYPDVAEEYFERAVELEPKNVAALDYLLEAAIINKNKPLALKAFNTLTGVENDPIKIQSYKDKIDIL